MNYMLFLVIAIPLVLPWVCRFFWPREITWKEMIVACVASAALSGTVYGLGLYGETADVEILNGEVVSKERIHDSYQKPYDCNCKTDKKGNRTCSTCYEDRYTVTWNCNTNLGTIRIDHEDSGSRSVYRKPDPARYTSIRPGDPVAVEHSFTNYVKAVPDSLFHPNQTRKFDALIPEYPNDVFDFYRINRVFAMGVPVPDLADWNQDLSMLLRKLGPQKQANVVVLFVNTNDQSYIHALEGKWIGGKKNDIIVVVGTTAYPKIDWVAVSSWTDKTLFKVQLRDEIFSQSTIDRAQILAAIDKHTMASFERKKMKDFEYLKTQIEPPVWVLTLSVILGIICSVGLSFYFYRNDPFGSNVGFRRRRF